MAGIIIFTDYADIIKEPFLANFTDVPSWHAGGGWHRLIANSIWREGELRSPMQEDVLLFPCLANSA